MPRQFTGLILPEAPGIESPFRVLKLTPLSGLLFQNLFPEMRHLQELVIDFKHIRSNDGPALIMINSIVRLLEVQQLTTLRLLNLKTVHREPH